MNTGIHLGYAWLVGDAADLSLGGRRTVALAGVAADLDGIAIILGREGFDTYHHVIFHNLFFAAAVTLTVLILFPRNLKIVLFAALAALLHLALDYLGSSWDLPLFRPFSRTAVNLTGLVPQWAVIYLLQGVGTVLMFVLMFRTYLKKERSFFEVVSTKIDKIIMNFLTLPWRNRCVKCGKRACYKCTECAATLCSNHRKFGRRLKVLCEKCEAAGNSETEAVKPTGTEGTVQ